jgi:hypothetical protein
LNISSIKLLKFALEQFLRQGVVPQTCNPSCLEGRDEEDCVSRKARPDKKIVRPPSQPMAVCDGTCLFSQKGLKHKHQVYGAGSARDKAKQKLKITNAKKGW